ncbi:MAG: PilZ domain-containing protein [Hyphomicrobiales bacterium]|nr:PilZ domain-containing protein [Hyphomicrobiales bacterium]
MTLTLLGRYMLSDRREYACSTVEVSPGAARLVAAVKGKPGERVVCYFEQLGRIEGTVAVAFDDGFAVEFSLPVVKREKVADQLTWLANRHALGMPEDRRHERIAPLHPRVAVKLADGREYLGKLVDVSISGAALETEAAPQIGASILIGSTTAQIVRALPGGFAVEFAKPIPAADFTEGVRL